MCVTAYGLCNSQPTYGLCNSQPTYGLCNSQPTYGLCNSQPTYGLCNSQPTYQDIMDKTLDGVDNADSFVGDVCTYSKIFDDMLNTLREVFVRYRKANLQMRTDKCQFGYTETDYVGYHISGEGLSPIRENIDAILSFEAPTNLKGLERFIGMVGYYREFLPQMAEIVDPLNHLRQKGQPFVWSAECEKAFRTVKKCLISPPVLIVPNWNEPFYIEADACDVSVGGILSQKDELSGALRPIGYYSASLDKHQRNYSSEERECWSLVATTRKWRTYCRAAIKIILLTDHNPLKWRRSRPDPRGKFARWLIELEEIPYEIAYRNGLDHTVPDCLSRTNRPQIDLKLNNDDDHFESRILAVDVISNDEWNERIRVAQKDDEAIRFAIEQLQQNHEVRMGRFKRYKNVHLEKGILMQGVVPVTLRFEIVAPTTKKWVIPALLELSVLWHRIITGQVCIHILRTFVLIVRYVLKINVVKHRKNLYNPTH